VEDREDRVVPAAAAAVLVARCERRGARSQEKSEKYPG
jgi:hypothetical protein